ncbi:alpha-L RNA-binding motif-containing protein [Obba rivulosa]|uniref:Alpha-L RNA-binding motif-containing protein n=1 Tax=Obba rivulosa TaxID=1052685 RepID=A0A8E2B1U0_9APHY|nr:alpha-L RNA-binding motif-containing protein [Obba rivulosa]
MRDANLYNANRALPRMSWNPKNLYNLWRRCFGRELRERESQTAKGTLFQQRWAAKQLVRAYHGDFINEKIFKRWYLPSTLPDVRSHHNQGVGAGEKGSLLKWALKHDAAEAEARRKKEEDAKGLAPVGSLMFTEVERRIDVVIFRACLTHSVYEARRLVVHGDVLLNGKKHQNPNTRLAPGDMVSVDPKAIRFLQKSAAPKEEPEEAPEEQAATSLEASSEDATASEASADEAVTSESDSESASTSGTDSTPSETPSKPSHPSRYRSRLLGMTGLTPFYLPPYASPFIFVPPYLEPSFATCSVVYLRHPTARPGYSEIPTPWDADGSIVRLAWEWYSKRRPRIRSKRQLARMPENRH